MLNIFNCKSWLSFYLLFIWRDTWNFDRTWCYSRIWKNYFVLLIFTHPFCCEYFPCKFLLYIDNVSNLGSSWVLLSLHYHQYKYLFSLTSPQEIFLLRICNTCFLILHLTIIEELFEQRPSKRIKKKRS